jgi:uncharacterized protein (TIGR02246 family)
MRLRSGMAVLLVLGCAEPPPTPAEAAARVEALLVRSAAAWNRGDLDAFLSDYAVDSTTTFVAGGHVQYGFDWIRENYAPGFDPGADRDSLRFESVAARPLGNEYLLATARFVLFEGGSVTASGPFTLILQRHGPEWKIVHDHTSRDPE